MSGLSSIFGFLPLVLTAKFLSLLNASKIFAAQIFLCKDLENKFLLLIIEGMFMF